MRLRPFSIATKLYAIFVLLATVTVALASVAVWNARRHAMLTGEFEASSVKSVADDLGQVAASIRGQVDDFFEKLRAA